MTKTNFLSLFLKATKDSDSGSTCKVTCLYRNMDIRTYVHGKVIKDSSACGAETVPVPNLSVSRVRKTRAWFIHCSVSSVASFPDSTPQLLSHRVEKRGKSWGVEPGNETILLCGHVAAYMLDL